VGRPALAAFLFGNPCGLGMLPIKPGSSTIPMPGIEAAVMSLDGKTCGVNEKGIMVIKRPFPGLTPALWGEPERYGRDYWQIIPDVYYTGDSAQIEYGYVWFAGRADEIIKIAGHRIGTIEVETALLTHPAVAESGVIGHPDELPGEVISAFVVLRQGFMASDDLKKQLLDTVRHGLGPVAVIGELNFVDMIPKTRSGKIMRRVLKAVIQDRNPGDITTIEDEGSVDERGRHGTRCGRNSRTPDGSRGSVSCLGPSVNACGRPTSTGRRVKRTPQRTREEALADVL
jgi:acetyl-CoA synthetase